MGNKVENTGIKLGDTGVQKSEEVPKVSDTEKDNAILARLDQIDADNKALKEENKSLLEEVKAAKETTNQSFNIESVVKAAVSGGVNGVSKKNYAQANKEILDRHQETKKATVDALKKGKELPVFIPPAMAKQFGSTHGAGVIPFAINGVGFYIPVGQWVNVSPKIHKMVTRRLNAGQLQIMQNHLDLNKNMDNKKSWIEGSGTKKLK